MQNNSQPGPGTTGWFQGNSTVFNAQSGDASSYIATNFNNGTGVSTLSNWLLSPVVTLGSSAGLSFWTRTVNAPMFPDRLQVRWSANGASTNVGTTATDVGDFTTLLLDINPTYNTNGYPNVWTEYFIPLNMSPPVTGRLAFRYFVENGGPNGANSDYIGIDSVVIGPGCGGFVPTPTPSVTPSPTPTNTPFPTPFPEPVADFVVSAPVKWQVNTPLSFGVSARDIFGHAAPHYSGTVHFTSSDPAAHLPADSTLVQGMGVFVATLNTAGSQTITATDTVDPSITGTSLPINVMGPTPSPTATPTLTATPTPAPTPPTRALNLSTRLNVQPGDQAGIGGFIVTGTAPKQLLFRGIGPSLLGGGVSDILADPTLDLRDANGLQLMANNNWRDTQETEIEATGIAPTNDQEAAMLATLAPGSYTVILRDAEATGGIGLVEIYDLDQNPTAKLANLSTRAFVSTGNNVVIAGFILEGNGSDTVALRGIGPSLTGVAVPNALADPVLDLRDSNGSLVLGNNDWQDDPTQAAQLTGAGLAPTNALESGIMSNLSPGPYTAILTGRNGVMGVGLVEIYDLGE